MSLTDLPVVSDEREETHVAGRPVVARRHTVVSGDPAFRFVQLVWFLLGVTEGFIGLRVIFRAVAAHQVGFVSFIYGVSDALIAPFRGISPDYVRGTTVVEIGSLIAMAIYLLAGYLVVKLVRILTAPRRDDSGVAALERGSSSTTTTTYQ
ncbi:MAG: hypothetical protein ACREEC_13540, partial [Thermoplasmata archaeon]